MLGAAVVNRLCLRRGDAARGAGVAGVTIGGPCVPVSYTHLTLPTTPYV